MDKENTPCQMAVAMKVATKKMRKTVKVFTPGLMEDITREDG